MNTLCKGHPQPTLWAAYVDINGEHQCPPQCMLGLFEQAVILNGKPLCGGCRREVITVRYDDDLEKENLNQIGRNRCRHNARFQQMPNVPYKTIKNIFGEWADTLAQTCMQDLAVYRKWTGDRKEYPHLAEFGDIHKDKKWTKAHQARWERFLDNLTAPQEVPRERSFSIIRVSLIIVGIALLALTAYAFYKNGKCGRLLKRS